MNIRIVAFGYLSEIISENTIDLENISDVNSLRTALEKKFPDLNKRPYKIAVNRELVPGECKIDQLSEIALLPPFAGG